jgi:hypothetical protein
MKKGGMIMKKRTACMLIMIFLLFGVIFGFVLSPIKGGVFQGNQ